MEETVCNVNVLTLVTATVLLVSWIAMVFQFVITVKMVILGTAVNSVTMATLEMLWWVSFLHISLFFLFHSLQTGVCTLCQCYGNVDPTLGLTCNVTTGQCLQCQNHTTGFNCDQCLPGFYGDIPNGIPCQGTTYTCNNRYEKLVLIQSIVFIIIFNYVAMKANH